jgi:hypothetical protein
MEQLKLFWDEIPKEEQIWEGVCGHEGRLHPKNLIL